MNFANELIALLEGVSQYIAWIVATITEALGLFGV